MSRLEQEINSAKYDGEQQRIALEQKLNEVEDSYEHNKNLVTSLEQQNKDIQEKYEQLCAYMQKFEREKKEVESKCEASISHLKQEKEVIESKCEVSISLLKQEIAQSQVGVASHQQVLIQQLQVEKDEQRK